MEYPLTQRDPVKAKYSPYGTRTYHNPARIRERARQSIFSRAIAERALPYRGYVGPDAVMGGVLAARVGRSYPRGTAYEGIMRYNTNVDQIFTKGVELAQSAANTDVAVDFQLPLVVQQDGTAICAELIKVVAERDDGEDLTATLSNYQWRFDILVGTETGANLHINSDNNIASIGFNLWGSDPVAATTAVCWASQFQEIDLTDGNGNGIIVTQPLRANMSTANFQAAHTGWVKVYFKQKVLTTAAFVQQRQHERGLRT